MSIGLYIHVPFCRSKCPYCAFYFVVGRAELRGRYVDALVAEIGRAADRVPFAGRTLSSVYFGGGTPAVLEPAEVARVVRAAAAAFGLEPDAEVSLEANPDRLDASRIAGFREAGVNRLTLGFQATRPLRLRALGRTHSPGDSLRAYEGARAAGFENIAIDLIFGTPGQDAASWAAEVEEVAALAPEHVSVYELTPEEGTRLARHLREERVRLPDSDTRADMFDDAGEVLGRYGLERYEISNFARAHRECRHNADAWRGLDAIGVGASAASHAGNARWTNVADLDAYIARIESGEDATAEREILDEGTWAAEDLYLGLRLMEGIDATARLARLPEPARERITAVLETARAAGLLATGGGRFRLTQRGLLLADSVFEDLLTDVRPTAGR